MTTDLTGDFEVGEDELDWDVFLPDPDDAAVAAEAAALDDETELDLDDSHFEWERALRDDDGGRDDLQARAGAAYDRIVDTMRPPPAEPERAQTVAWAFDETPSREAPAVQAGLPSGFGTLEQPEPDIESAPAAFPTALGSEMARNPDVAFARDDHREASFEPIAGATWTPEPASTPPVPVLADTDAGVEAGDGSDAESDAFARWWAQDPDVVDADRNEDLDQNDRFDTRFEPRHAAPLVEQHFVEASPDAPISQDSPEAPDTVGFSTDPGQDPSDGWTLATPPEGVEAVAPLAAIPDLDLADDHPADLDTDDPEAQSPKKRSRVFKATVVAACLLLVAVIAVVAGRALHHATTPSAPPSHATAPPASTGGTSSSTAGSTAAADAARIRAATQAVNSATTAANVGITSLASFPTPTNVEAVINPYISSLQLFGTFLSGTKIPAAAQPAAASAQAQLQQDLTFLDTIDGLPPAQLGAFLEQFVTNTTHLQTTLTTLDQKLASSAS